MSKIFDIVKKHIDTYDYSCLLASGAPSDEFDSESRQISERISCMDEPKDIAKIMALIFQKTFDREETPDAFMDVANAVMEDMRNTQEIILEEAKPTALEMSKLIYQQTGDKKFTRNMLIFLSSEHEKKQMIRFIKENDPNLQEINHRSIEISFEKI